MHFLMCDCNGNMRNIDLEDFSNYCDLKIVIKVPIPLKYTTNPMCTELSMKSPANPT